MLVGAVILLALAWIGAPRRAHATTSTITGTIKDSQGNPVNGTLTFQLPIPAVDTGTNTAISPGVASYQVVNGVIQSGPPLFDVAGLQPSNLYYIAKVFDSAGNLVLGGNYVVTGASFNFGTAVPTTVTTSNISFVTPVTTSAPNAFTATQSAPVFASTTTPLAASGFLRMGNIDSLCWRNAGNTSDVCLGVPSVSPGGTFAFSTPVTSVATNFGTNITITTIANVPITGVVETILQPVQSTLGVGCSAVGNGVNVTLLWTGPSGTTESAAVTGLNITGNGVLDAGSGSTGSNNINSLAVQANSNIQFSASSTLASTGCTTVPQYKIYAKVIQ
jgi:hypothetical protein